MSNVMSKPIGIAVEYKFDWYEHCFYKMEEDSRLTLLCFCDNPMVYNRGKMVCNTKECNFVVDMASLNAFIKNDMLKSPNIKIPICKTCHGASLECYRNEAWAAYLDPFFRCSCKPDIQMMITRSAFPEVMEANFTLKPKDAAVAISKVNSLKKLPNKKLTDRVDVQQATTSGMIQKKVPKKPAIAASNDDGESTAEDEPEVVAKPIKTPKKKPIQKN